MRPSKDETLLRNAWAWAEQGTCSRLRVGAVVARDTRPIVAGYNGAPSGVEHCRHDGTETHCDLAVHAEMNAIGYAARAGATTDGCTLYVTHAPCQHCAPVVIAAGIARVVYARPYRSDRGVFRLMEAGIKVQRLDVGPPNERMS